MPFILVHPAAALPLQRYMGRHAVVSALIIGSMTPDMHYFLPLGITRGEAHSLDGLLWFCLPVGVALYLLYHFVLKYPLSLLLPASLRARLLPWINSRLPSRSWKAVILSLLLGAITHLIWDAFTHQYATGTLALPALRATWFTVGQFPVPGYEALQQLSNLLGFLILGLWARRWIIDRAPSTPIGPQHNLPPLLRGVILVSIVLIASGFAFIRIHFSAPLLDPTFLRLHIRIKDATVAAMSSAGLALLIYSLLWQAQTHWRRMAGAK